MGDKSGPCSPGSVGTASPPCPGAPGTSSSLQSSLFSSRFLRGHRDIPTPPDPQIPLTPPQTPRSPSLHPIPPSPTSLPSPPCFPAQGPPLPPWGCVWDPRFLCVPLPAGRGLQPQVGEGLVHGQEDVDVGESHGQGHGAGVVAVLDADPRGTGRAVPVHAEPQRRRAGAQPRELGGWRWGVGGQREPPTPQELCGGPGAPALPAQGSPGT